MSGVTLSGNVRLVLSASSAMTQTAGVALVFIKFLERAVVHAGRQNLCSESSEYRSGLTEWTSEYSAKTKPKSCAGTGQLTEAVRAGGAAAG